MDYLVETFYPFTDAIKLKFALGITVFLLGIIGNSILLYLWWKYQKEDTDRSAILIISVDLLAIFHVILEAITLRLEGFYDNHLGSGVAICIALGNAGYTICLTSLVATTLYSYQRYRIIFQKEPLPLTKCFAFIGCYFFLNLMVAISSVPLGVPMQYAPSGTYCTIDYASRSTYMLLYPMLFAFLSNFACQNRMVYMYIRILKKFKEISNEINGSSQSEMGKQSGLNDSNAGGTTITEEFAKRQRSLFRRVVIIVSIALICYFPYVVVGFYEGISGYPAPILFDQIASSLLIANGFVDFLVFIVTNATFRRRFWELFGIEVEG